MLIPHHIGPVPRSTKFADHNDDFPTPPWAVRALVEYVLPNPILRGVRVLEPACGRGHIVVTLRAFGAKVAASDAFKYDDGIKATVRDYLSPNWSPAAHDLVITNPPYAQSSKFVLRALKEAELGVAMLMQTLWLKGVNRWNDILSVHPPTTVGFFTRLMPAKRGAVIRKAPVIMSHSWFWWDKSHKPYAGTRLIFIPPTAQADLGRSQDYEASFFKKGK